MGLRAPALAGLALALAGAGCAATGGLPDTVTCDVLHRPQVGSATGETSTELVLPRQGGASTAGETLRLPPMELTGRFGDDAPEGRSVTIAVTGTDGTQLLQVLYQVDEEGRPLDAEFAGGHGFTGLHYVHHEGAELQFWCESA